jgi:hypothetical protein
MGVGIGAVVFNGEFDTMDSHQSINECEDKRIFAQREDAIEKQRLKVFAGAAEVCSSKLPVP